MPDFYLNSSYYLCVLVLLPLLKIFPFCLMNLTENIDNRQQLCYTSHRFYFQGVKMKKSRLLKRFLLSMLTASFIMPLGVMADSPSEENLVEGLPYTVETGVDISYSYGMYPSADNPQETKAELGKLTDGKNVASLSYSDPAWHKFYRGLSRTITFELPEVKAVTGFKIHTIKNNSAGLQLSNYYDLYVSENGTDWMKAYSYDNSHKTAGEDKKDERIIISALGIGRFRAKYVRIKFRIEVNTFIDEIEIFGTDINGTEAEFVKYVDPFKYKNAYNPGIEGCRDLVLLYCGYEGTLDRSFVENTEEEMLYYCGYVSPKGEILDTMFDSFMFSALQNTLPSGRKCGQGGDPPLMSDWQFFIDSIFDEEFNCGAIERALDKVKAATGKSDYTMQLVINMPYPNIGPDAVFGDIDGDGKDEYCRNEEEQLKIYAWFMDAVIQKMAERNYKNIRLGGFYWEPESIKTSLGEEIYTFMGKVADLIHERNLYFFWIPVLYANGMDKLEEMGFDVAMMQPDIPWAKDDYMKYEMFYGMSEALKKYGFGLEYEIHWDVQSVSAKDFNKRVRQFYAYLDASYALGMMTDASHSYYQNSNPGSFYHLARSTSSIQREIYDDVYAFIKKQYKPQVSVSAKEYNAKSGEKLYAYMNIKRNANAITKHGDVYLEVVTHPSQGTLELSPKTGDFSYTSEPGFEGVDTFTVVVRNEFILTDPYEIKINVTNGQGDESPAEESLEESLTESKPENSKSDDDKGNLGVPLAIGGAIAAGAAAAVIIGKKKRNKK
jgi:hypothetical protein